MLLLRRCRGLPHDISVNYWSRVGRTRRSFGGQSSGSENHSMKHIGLKGLLVFGLLGFSLASRANVIISDTWQDGTRTDPTAANGYAENNGVVGTDADNDG